MEGILHSNSVHSQILFNTTYLNIYIEEKHDSSVIIQYVRRDHNKMQIRENVTATSLFVTPSILPRVMPSRSLCVCKTRGHSEALIVQSQTKDSNQRTHMKKQGIQEEILNRVKQ